MNLWCRRSLLFALLLFVFLVPVQATTLVTDIDGNAAAGDWYNGSSGGGSATLIDLTGLGGNLENNASLPNGVVKLTTGADNGDRGEIGMQGDFGLASVVLNDVAIGYDYYKENVGNPSAAPAIKLTLWGQGTGDNYGTLVYEPTWNQPGGGSSLVPTGDWQTVSINQATGNGDISSGGGGGQEGLRMIIPLRAHRLGLYLSGQLLSPLILILLLHTLLVSILVLVHIIKIKSDTLIMFHCLVPLEGLISHTISKQREPLSQNPPQWFSSDSAC